LKIHPYPSKDAEARLDTIINRTIEFRKEDADRVAAIIDDVKTNGDEALIRYNRKFDAPDITIDSIRVTEVEINAAEGSVDRDVLKALERAAGQIASFHRRQVRNSWIQTDRPGTLLGQLYNPVDAAGVYVPGGKGGSTPLVSSVLMGVIPAKIAGVRRICMATPPREDGTVNPYLLATARLAGVDEIYKMGSAWAVAALAHGTATVPKVDVIVGPGNVFVTLAKKLVSGTVGIDMIAGPSEILVIADDSGEPDFIAADLLSQAEHDPLASAVLVATSPEIGRAVADAVASQLKALDRKEIAERSIADYGAIFTVADLETAFDLANRIAPEHLELQVADPMSHIGRIRNAGAVFLGRYTPEPVGDYIAGPNHVLPTAGTARFSSALSVDDFTKKTSLISYSKSAFMAEADDVVRLAKVEGLDAHARSIQIRRKS
jgi:histidinol dehydrogenase